MQANFPFDDYSNRCRSLDISISPDAADLYTRDHARWSERTLAYVSFRFRSRRQPWIDAEDINQNVWMSAWVHYEKLRSDSDNRRWAWLVVTTKGKIIDAQRRTRRRGSMEECSDIAGSDRLGAPIQCGAIPPLAQASTKELRGVIDRHLLSLPPLGQEVIRLRYYADYDWATIGRRMNRPATSCESLLRRTRERLASALPQALLFDLEETTVSGEWRDP